MDYIFYVPYCAALSMKQKADISGDSLTICLTISNVLVRDTAVYSDGGLLTHFAKLPKEFDAWEKEATPKSQKALDS